MSILAIASFLVVSTKAGAHQNPLRPPKVTSPPESFFAKVRDSDRDSARAFYKKYIDVKGMPVVSSGVVADAALQRTFTIVTSMLAGRPDVIEAMVKSGILSDHHWQGPGLHGHA